MKKNLVVMQVLPKLESGGVERGTIEIATALKKENIPNIVVSGGGKMVQELQYLNIPHITLPVHTKNPFKMWLNSFKLEKIIKQYGITLVHVRSRAPAFSVKWACARAKVPFLTTYHGVYNATNKLKWWYNKIMTTGQKIIAVSDFVKKHILNAYDISPEKIHLIHRGVDCNRLNPETVHPERIIQLATKYQISTEKPIILLHGRITKWKGQHLLLEALSKMKNKNVTAVLAGSDQGKTEYTNSLLHQISNLSSQTSVHLITEKTDVPALYLLCDIFVSPSIEPEAFGRVTVEAQSMGRIVIASAHGGACETVEDGVTGFLVEPNNAAALAEKLDFALEMSLNARKKMEYTAMTSSRKNFSIDIMCNKTIDVYKEILHGKK